MDSPRPRELVLSGGSPSSDTGGQSQLRFQANRFHLQLVGRRGKSRRVKTASSSRKEVRFLREENNFVALSRCLLKSLNIFALLKFIIPRFFKSNTREFAEDGILGIESRHFSILCESESSRLPAAFLFPRICPLTYSISQIHISNSADFRASRVSDRAWERFDEVYPIRLHVEVSLIISRQA